MIDSPLSDILGAPNTGFHAAVRVFDLAIMDVVGVFIFAFVYKHFTKFSMLTCSSRVFVIAQMLHVFCCVRTSFLVHYPLQVIAPVLAVCFYGSKFQYHETCIVLVYIVMIAAIIVLRNS